MLQHPMAKRLASFFFDSAGMKQGVPCTTRSMIPFGSPMEGFINADDEITVQRKLYLENQQEAEEKMLVKFEKQQSGLFGTPYQDGWTALTDGDTGKANFHTE